MEHYVITVLVDENPKTVVIHIRSNDITTFNYHEVDVSNLAYRILQIGLKCIYYSVESIAISSVLVKNDNNLKYFIKTFMQSLRFWFYM